VLLEGHDSLQWLSDYVLMESVEIAFRPFGPMVVIAGVFRSIVESSLSGLQSKSPIT